MGNSDIDPIVYEMAKDCVAARLRSLSRLVSGIYADAIRPHGLTISQINILVVIGLLKGTRPKDICSILQLDTSTLSRNISRMVERGWIKSEPDADGRAHVLEITAKGRSLLKRAYPDWRIAQDKAKALLGNDEADGIVSIANQVVMGGK